MVGFLMGIHGVCTKDLCYLCLCDSRADAQHYDQRSWPPNTEFYIGKWNVKCYLIAKTENIIMPPLQNRNNQTICKKSEAFTIVDNLFQLSDAKVEPRVFLGTQVKNLFTI